MAHLGDSNCFARAMRLMWIGEITESEYFQRVLKHYQGVRHAEDELPWKDMGNSSHPNRKNKPLIRHAARAIHDSALGGQYENFSDESITAIELIFGSCMVDDSSGLQQALYQYNTSVTKTQTGTKDAKLPFIQAVAILAAENGYVDCLKLAFKNGATFAGPLSEISFELSYTKSPALLEFLHEHDWKQMKTSKTSMQRLSSHMMRTLEAHSEAGSVIRWFVDHDTIITTTEIQRAVLCRIHESAIAELLVLNHDATISQGAVSTAVYYGNINVVMRLLDAGASTGGVGGGFDDPREQVLKDTPLNEAVKGTLERAGGPKLESRLEIARLLLERGADPNEKGWATSPYRIASRNKIEPFIKLFEEYGVAE